MDKIVFVGGLHRSGTTTVAKILSSLPNCQGFEDTKSLMDEGQRLQTVLPTDQALGGVSEFFVWSDRDKKSISEKEKASIVSDWKNDLSGSDEEIFIEKSPVNCARMEMLLKAFPQSKGVFVVRHPIAVVLASLKWSRVSPMTSFLNYSLYMKEIDRVKKLEIFEGRISVLKFEEINSIRLKDVLGDWVADCSDNYKVSLDNSAYEEFFQKIKERKLPAYDLDARGIWRNRLLNALSKLSNRFALCPISLEHEIPAIIHLYGDQINDWGYSSNSLTVL